MFTAPHASLGMKLARGARVTAKFGDSIPVLSSLRRSWLTIDNRPGVRTRGSHPPRSTPHPVGVASSHRQIPHHPIECARLSLRDTTRGRRSNEADCVLVCTGTRSVRQYRTRRDATRLTDAQLATIGSPTEAASISDDRRIHRRLNNQSHTRTWESRFDDGTRRVS